MTLSPALPPHGAPALVRLLGQELAQALSVLHGHAIVHGNVEASNVLLRLASEARDGGGRLLLGDFGASARLLAEGRAAGAGCGSCGPSAPEQAAATRPSRTLKTDVYQLGLLLMRLTLREASMPSSPTEQVAFEHARRDIPFLMNGGGRFKALIASFRRADAPLAELVLARMLPYAEGERGSAAEVATALAGILADTHPAALTAARADLWRPTAVELAAAQQLADLRRDHAALKRRHEAARPPSKRPLFAGLGLEGAALNLSSEATGAALPSATAGVAAPGGSGLRTQEGR